MAYNPIEIDREELTIMGVSFADTDALDRAANAIGSNMFEGFIPTAALIKLFRDYSQGEITRDILPRMIQEAL